MSADTRASDSANSSSAFSRHTRHLRGTPLSARRCARPSMPIAEGSPNEARTLARRSIGRRAGLRECMSDNAACACRGRPMAPRPLLLLPPRLLRFRRGLIIISVEQSLGVLGDLRFGGLAKRHIHLARGRVVDPLATEEVCDCEKLNARMLGPPRRLIEAGGCCFGAHGSCWLLHGDQNSDRRSFALDHTAEVTKLRRGYVACLDREHNLLRLPTRAVIVEIQPTVDPLVGALLSFRRASAHQPQRPPLQLVRVLPRERRGASLVRRIAYDVVALAGLDSRCVLEALLDEADCEVGNVNSDPPALEPLRDRDGCSASAERIEHNSALIAARPDDALQERLRLLSRVAESLCRSGIERRNVRPDIGQRLSPLLVEETLEARHRSGARLDHKSGLECCLHPILGPAPHASYP